MKAKYYPHLTVAGAVLLTAAPLCFVLSLNGASSTGELEALIAQTEGDQTHKQTSAGQGERATRVEPLSFEPSAPSLVSASPEKSASTPSSSPVIADITRASHEPRVAMSQDRPVRAAPVDPPPPMSDAAAVMDMALLSDPDEGRLDEPIPSVPVPDEEGAPGVASEEPTAGSLHVTHPTSPVVKTLVDAGSHFGATAHLAMRESFRDPGRDSRQHQRMTSDAMDGSLSLSEPDGRMTGLASDTPMMGGNVVLPEPEGFDRPVEAAREDVILQQPLESRPVSRVENIVAVTKAKGWPVALVRSDLPDDHWWVQQMVGIRGNAFAARANFGNENSIRGSVYHLVFVFLDSPEEVRRFRIAKQFKDLPEGIRRSREFTFTRR
ncbi:MAG: hypothetical protein NXI04_00905 [Planctomycetaceae bacterium]|nr:hypothetical protein [Planctomycetaceae bacterium]